MTWNGYIDNISNKFAEGVYDLSGDVAKALDDLASNPSDPSLLAAYQSKLSEYTIYRNAQSAAVKAIKDIDQTILSKW